MPDETMFGSMHNDNADWQLPDGDGLPIADTAADSGAKTFIMSSYLFRCRAAGPSVMTR